MSHYRGAEVGAGVVADTQAELRPVQ